MAALRPSDQFKNKTNTDESIDRYKEIGADDFTEAGNILDDHADGIDANSEKIGDPSTMPTNEKVDLSVAIAEVFQKAISEGTLAETNAKTYADTLISNLIGGAPAAYNTLQEIAAWLQNEDSEDVTTEAALLALINTAQTTAGTALTQAYQGQEDAEVARVLADNTETLLLTGSDAYVRAKAITQLTGGSSKDLIALEKVISDNSTAKLIVAPYLQADSKLPAALPLNGSVNATFTGGGGSYVDKFGLIKQGSVDVPRISHRIVDGKMTPFYLIESVDVTNKLKNSNNLNLWNNYGSVNVTASSEQSPSGDLDCWLVQGATGNIRYNEVLQNDVGGLSSSSKYTSGIYLKSAGASTCSWYMLDGFSGEHSNITVDLSDGEWHRLPLTRTTGDSTSTLQCYIGNSDGDLLAWEGQLQAGDYLTSQVHTESSEVTRLKDSNMTFSAPLNVNKGSFKVGIATDNTSGSERVSLSNGTVNDIIRIAYNGTSGVIQMKGSINGSNAWFNDLTGLDLSKLQEIEITWLWDEASQVTNAELFHNGVFVEARVFPNKFASLTQFRTSDYGAFAIFKGSLAYAIVK